MDHAANSKMAWSSILLWFYPGDVQLVGQSKKGTSLAVLDSSESFPHLGAQMGLGLSGELCASTHSDTNMPFESQIFGCPLQDI